MPSLPPIKTIKKPRVPRSFSRVVAEAIPAPILERLPSWLSFDDKSPFSLDEAGSIITNPNLQLYDDALLEKIPEKYRDHFRKGTIPPALAQKVIDSIKSDHSEALSSVQAIEDKYGVNAKNSKIRDLASNADAEGHREASDAVMNQDKEIYALLHDNPVYAPIFELDSILGRGDYDFSHFGSVKKKLSRISSRADAKKLSKDDYLLLSKYSHFLPPELASLTFGDSLRNHLPKGNSSVKVSDVIPTSTGPGLSISGISEGYVPSSFRDTTVDNLSPALETELLQMLRSYYSSHSGPGGRKYPGRDIFKLTPLANALRSRLLSGVKFDKYVPTIEARLSELNNGAIPNLTHASYFVKQKRKRISDKKELSVDDAETIRVGKELYASLYDYITNPDSFPSVDKAGFEAIRDQFQYPGKLDNDFYYELANSYFDAIDLAKNSGDDYTLFKKVKKGGKETYEEASDDEINDSDTFYVKDENGEFVVADDPFDYKKTYSTSDTTYRGTELGAHADRDMHAGADEDDIEFGEGSYDSTDANKYKRVGLNIGKKSEAYTTVTPEFTKNGGVSFDENNFNANNVSYDSGGNGFLDIFFPRVSFPLPVKAEPLEEVSAKPLKDFKTLYDHLAIQNAKTWNPSEPDPVIAFDFENPSSLSAFQTNPRKGITSFFTPEFRDLLARSVAEIRRAGLPKNIALDLLPSKQFFGLKKLPSGEDFSTELLKNAIYNYVLYEYPDLFTGKSPLIKFYTSTHPNELFRPTPGSGGSYTPFYFKRLDGKKSNRYLTNFLRATTKDKQDRALALLSPHLARLAQRGLNYYDYYKRYRPDLVGGDYTDLAEALFYLSKGNVPAALSFYSRHIHNASPEGEFSTYNDDPRELLLSLLDTISGFLAYRP